MEAGSVIGSYRIVRLLGKGGMGEVYLAEHEHTGWKRAIKVLPEDLSKSTQFVERFKREAAVLDSLKHPHIVRVQEMGESEGHYYIVMDYIEGPDGKPETLADYQKKSEGRIKPESLGKLLIQVCNALEFAHSKGIIHRDLKPANILLKYKHGAIVSDFGLARVVGDQFLRSRINESISASMSRGDANASIGADRTEALDLSSQSLLGTWDYMSPEVKKGKEATTKSDIYALGVILYRCLTGAPRLSFEPPSELVEGVSPNWDKVYRKMAATLPSKRYDNCQRIITDLEDCLTPEKKVTSFQSASQEQTKWEEEQIQRREKHSLEMNLHSAVERKDRQEVIRIREVLEDKDWLDDHLIELINQNPTTRDKHVVETSTPVPPTKVKNKRILLVGIITLIAIGLFHWLTPDKLPTLDWVKRVDGTRAIAALPDGSVLATGSFATEATFGMGEAGDTTLASAGKYDIFIAKYNPEGTLAWAKRAGGAHGDSGSSIAALDDGSALVTGCFYEGEATFGLGEAAETTLASAGGDKFFIAKYNPDGTLAWAKVIGESGDNKGINIAAVPDGSALVTGGYSDNVFRIGIDKVTFGLGEPAETTLVSESSGSSDIFIAKYNPEGTLAWAKSVGAKYYGSGPNSRIAALHDGSALVTGYLIGDATFGMGEAVETTLVSAPSQNNFIAKYNSDGTLAWAKRVQGWCSSIATLDDGSALVTGNYSGKGTFGLEDPAETTLASAGKAKFFIAKYNPDGTLAWAKSAAGNYANRGNDNSIAALPDGSALVTGAFQGKATFGPREAAETILESRWDDIFIAKYDPDGTLAWATSAGGVRDDHSRSITALPEGNVFFVVQDSREGIFIAKFVPN